MVELYWYVATISSGLLGLIILFNIIGFDIDEIDVGLDFFSFNSLVGFFCVGGWTGYLANDFTVFDQWIVLALAVLAGLVTYVGSIYILKRLKNWESSGNIQLSNAIGKVGKVYLGIPPKGEGEGQVEVMIQERLKIVRAISHADKIDTGSKVIVFDLVDNKLVVEPYNEES
ncbi:hypothetical protein [Ekhidna sp.]